MEPSPELRSRVLALYDLLIGAADTSGIVLDAPGVHGTGSDPNEWWDGGAHLAAVLTAQGAALRGSQIVDCDPQAWVEGDVGWAYDRFIYRTPDGTEAPFRITATFVRRDGEWRLVLWHDSVPISNEEAIGTTIPT